MSVVSPISPYAGSSAFLGGIQSGLEALAQASAEKMHREQLQQSLLFHLSEMQHRLSQEQIERDRLNLDEHSRQDRLNWERQARSDALDERKYQSDQLNAYRNQELELRRQAAQKDQFEQSQFEGSLGRLLPQPGFGTPPQAAPQAGGAVPGGATPVPGGMYGPPAPLQGEPAPQPNESLLTPRINPAGFSMTGGDVPQGQAVAAPQPQPMDLGAWAQAGSPIGQWRQQLRQTLASLPRHQAAPLLAEYEKNRQTADFIRSAYGHDAFAGKLADATEAGMSREEFDQFSQRATMMNDPRVKAYLQANGMGMDAQLPMAMMTHLAQQGDPQELAAALMQVHPEAGPAEAAAAVLLRQNEMPVGLGEANFSGRPRADKVKQDPRYIAAEEEFRIAGAKVTALKSGGALAYDDNMKQALKDQADAGEKLLTTMRDLTGTNQTQAPAVKYTDKLTIGGKETTVGGAGLRPEDTLQLWNQAKDEFTRRNNRRPGNADRDAVIAIRDELVSRQRKR